MRLCPRHGPYRVTVGNVVPFVPMEPQSAARPGIECPTCRTERQARNTEQAQRTQHAELMAASGIPSRFLDKTLTNLIAPAGEERFDAAMRAIQLYARELSAGGSGVGRWLILSGKPGTGKTHIACGLARLYIESTQASSPNQMMTGSLRCLYAHTHDLLAAVKSTYHREAVITEREALRQYIEPQLLILDEVGTTRLSPIDIDLLFRVLSARYDQMKPVVLVTNLTLPELAATVGERVIDRARDDGGLAIQCDWPSYRHDAATRRSGGAAFDFTFF